MDAVSEQIRLKYAHKVTPEYDVAMQAIGFARMLMAQHRAQYDALLESREYMDNVGGLLDPTLYLDVLHSKSLALQMRMVKAAVAFHDEIEKITVEFEKLK
jgi:hypothetical protein